MISNRDRGFARLGKKADCVLCGISTVMQQQGYEVDTQGNDIWVRYQPRQLGTFPLSYARILSVSEAAVPASWNTEWVANTDKQYDQFGEVKSLRQCLSMLADAANDPDYKFLYWLDAALIQCPRADRATFIRDHFLPAFRNRFPEGRVVFIGTNYKFESRLSLLRQGNYYQINGRQGFDDMELHGVASPQTAHALHSSGVIALDNALTVLLGNFLPLHTHIVGGKLGLRVVYLFGNAAPQVIDRGRFPREKIELQIPQFFLRGDDPAAFCHNPADPLGGWSGRYRNSDYPGDAAVVELIRAFVDRFNSHAENRLELCNFVNGDDIDFISAFEKYLTIDRIMLECIMIATATNAATARLMTFAVLDKFQELCSFVGVPQGRNFHYMCSQPFLNQVLLPSLAMLPAPWANFFRGKAEAIYLDLYATIRSAQGVWPVFLIQPGAVRVYRDYDQVTHQFVNRAAPLADDDFVGEYVRAARNTHHGYVSDGDRRRRFACFGSISTARLPDSFTQLPLLLVLAEIANPRSMSGHHWLDQAALNPV
jgi:hypothetical protein